MPETCPTYFAVKCTAASPTTGMQSYDVPVTGATSVACVLQALRAALPAPAAGALCGTTGLSAGCVTLLFSRALDGGEQAALQASLAGYDEGAQQVRIDASNHTPTSHVFPAVSITGFSSPPVFTRVFSWLQPGAASSVVVNSVARPASSSLASANAYDVRIVDMTAAAVLGSATFSNADALCGNVVTLSQPPAQGARTTLELHVRMGSNSTATGLTVASLVVYEYT